MESPFRSESAAFRFVLITIGAFALIVLASWINPWLGLVTFLLLTAAAIVVYMRERGPTPPPERVEHVGPADVRRVLVVANETLAGKDLIEAMGEMALSGKTEFLVVSPAHTTLLKTWTNDEDPARAEAQQRLDATLAHLAEIGIEARGEVGDVDPLVAIEDAVHLFHPDEIVISTHPEGRSDWLEKGVVAHARERFDVPITHVVVDLGTP
jgi:GABA permease